ncbi:MAG: GNAT family N-acetyltransferase [Bacillota bacterium]
MTQKNVNLNKGNPSKAVSVPDRAKWLTFREAESMDAAYINDLALREIGVTLRRLPKHKTLMIYQNKKLIGFISYRRVSENYLYIYALAFEKEAQNQGNARPAVIRIIKKERETAPLDGIFARIYKTNQAALHAALVKYGYRVINELPRYYVLFDNIQKKS